MVSGAAAFSISTSGLSEGKYGISAYADNNRTIYGETSRTLGTLATTAKTISVGQDETITVDFKINNVRCADVTGRVFAFITGVGYNSEFIRGKAKIIIPDLSSGGYYASIIYEGDGKYFPLYGGMVGFIVK